MKKLILIVAFIFCGSCNYAYAQEQEPKVCVSQDAANKCRDNAKLIPALEAKIAALEEAIKVEKQNTAEAKATAALNESDLKGRLSKTENELSEKTGQLIQAEATNVRLTSIIDFMLKNGRNKCGGFTVICIQ